MFFRQIIAEIAGHSNCRTLIDDVRKLLIFELALKNARISLLTVSQIILQKPYVSSNYIAGNCSKIGTKLKMCENS